jgi:hypothetical protein
LSNLPQAGVDGCPAGDHEARSSAGALGRPKDFRQKPIDGILNDEHSSWVKTVQDPDPAGVRSNGHILAFEIFYAVFYFFKAKAVNGRAR